MDFKSTNKVQTSMETVLVAKTNTTPTGSLVGATTAFNITDGQVAVLSFDLEGTPVMGNFLTLAGAPTSTTNAVKLIQGTPKSSAIQTVDPFEVGDPATVESDIIRFGSILDYKKADASFGQLSAELRTLTGTVGAGKTYDAYLFLNSVRGDRDYSDNDEVIYEGLDTPADLAGITDTSNYVLQNLIYKLNSRSKIVSTSNSAVNRRGNKDYVVLGVNTTGGAGTVVNTLAQGASVNIMTDGGVITSLPITNEIVTTFAKLVDNGDLVGTATIEVVNTATASTTSNVDAFITLGLDQNIAAYFDDITQVRTQVTVNLGEQFIADGFTSASIAGVEAVGSGRGNLIASRDRHQLTVHTAQNHPHGEFFSEGYQYVDASKWYNSAIISHYDYEETITVRPRYHKRTVVLWNAVPATGTTVATAVTALGLSNPAVVFTATAPASIAIFEAWKDR